jgi:hypothetical protein
LRRGLFFGMGNWGFSVGGVGGDGAGGGADGEPFGGAGEAAPNGTASGDTQRVVSFVGERGGLEFFVGEVVLSCSESCLAGFAFERKVVERFEVFRGN